jgi:hypothetical protein
MLLFFRFKSIAGSEFFTKFFKHYLDNKDGKSG